ncbi:rhomboid family intramembrane serine protease [Rhizobium sp. XQZ8]|uniref:rhomboid family intramembrane serine protease n=1 Tax=Rhizobium populisoli TaxID=2859785 RepID=UPI001C6866AC|nr:rhomboid family intramembrane serine protease [Rhizobium populisoli]MBW6423825.1 rhomboid family intramembrane serine protease [Rhizobium populisoli]
MFIPLHDAVELKYIRIQFVTIGLIAVNIIIWLLSTMASPATVEHASLGLGFIPAVIFDHAVLDPSLIVVPEDATFITYAFLHLDFWHLASNMLFLWVFGDNVEDALGHMRFFIFYLLCAAAGAALHGFVGPESQGPLIGASGAISGVVAAYFLLHPRVQVWVLVLLRIPLPLPAFIPLALWIVQQFVMLWFDLDGMVSWGAHVGGIVAGALLVLVMRRKGVPLFDRALITPRAVRRKLTVPQVGHALE